MRSFRSNLSFAQACLAEWPDYERVETLFWSLSAKPPADSPPYLQMTLGNLLLALDEMRAAEPQLAPEDRSAVVRALAEWEACWAGRSVRLEVKVGREVASRVGQWQAYVADALESGDLSDYANHVRPRLCAVRLIESLGTRSEQAAACLSELEAGDARLDAWLVEGPCLLGEELASIYPPSARYRFLYRRPGGNG
jgi:hypothetical protein